jgi:hypothetical protein
MLVEDSNFLKEFDQEQDYLNDEIVMNDLKYIEYLYNDPNLLNLYESLNLFNTLVKYDFKQLTEYTFLFYYKFGGHYFNEYGFMSIPLKIIGKIKRKKIFKHLCKKGLILACKWIYSLGIIDIHYHNDLYFRIACKYGHIELAKWIYSFGNIDVHIFDDEVYVLSIVNNKIELFKWLYTIDKCNNLLRIYIKICHYGHIELIDLFKDVKPTEYDLIDLFIMVCFYGQLEIAKYLRKTYSIVIKNYVLEAVVKSKHTNVFKWLLSLYEDEVDFNKLFENAILNNRIENVKYLHTLHDYKLKQKEICYLLAYDYFEMLHYFYSKYEIIVNYNILLSSFKSIEILKIVINMLKPSYFQLQFSFKEYSRYSSPEVLEYLYTNFKISDETICVGFENSCINNRIDNIYMINSFFDISRYYYNNKYNINISQKISNIFKISVPHDNLELIQYLYLLEHFSLYFNQNEIFEESLSKKSIKIAMWIYSFNKFDTKILNMFFRYAIENLDYKLIRKIYKPNDKIYYEYFNDVFKFNKETASKFLKIFKFLYYRKIIIFDHTEFKDLLIACCVVGTLNIAKWINTLKILNIHENNEEAFRISC